MVPYSQRGLRFSVEISDYLYTAYNNMDGISGNLVESSGTIGGGNGRTIHTEPRNALLIFAEPRLDDEFEPPVSLDDVIYAVEPGLVDNLNNVTANIIYFQPGIYYMPWNYHAKFSAEVKWVYMAPGAYVKGAFQFLHDTQTRYKFTGFGIVSGEKYVYEADVNNGYRHKTTENCHGTCVDLLRLTSTAEYSQQLDFHGVSFVEPPYHSFVVYGDENSFRMNVSQFKMLGAWYWQTDGLELYTNSVMQNVFLHSNDDVLKIYHGNLRINNTVIWKNENGPVIQWGWAPRNIQNVVVNNTYVIHNKMYWTDVKENTCVINSCGPWSPDVHADNTKNIGHITIENLFVEGAVNCAIRLFSMANTREIRVKNFQIGAWNDLDMESQKSLFEKSATVDGGDLTVGVGDEGLTLSEYTVAGKRINNQNAATIGRIAFNQSLATNWQLV